jgi:hypothetical protein
MVTHNFQTKQFRPKLYQSPTNKGVQNHMSTSVLPPGLLAKLSPYIMGTGPLVSWQLTPCMLLWAYLLGLVNRLVVTVSSSPPKVARIGIVKPP